MSLSNCLDRWCYSLPGVALVIGLGCLSPAATLVTAAKEATNRPARSTIRHASWQKAKLVATLTGHTGFIHAGVISPDGRIFASASSDQTVKLWNLKTGKLLHTLSGHRGHVTAIAFSPDGHLLASAGDDKVINLWDPSTGRLLKTVEGKSEKIVALYFAPDGQQLKSSNAVGAIQVWDMKPQAAFHSLKLSSYPSDLITVYPVFSPNGTTVAIGVSNLTHTPQDEPVRLWDTVTGSSLGFLPSEQRCRPSYILSVRFSPDGRSLASGMATSESSNGIIQKICLWDLNTKQLRYVLVGHTMGVWGLAFTADSKLLATGSADGTIRIWDLATGKQRGMILTHKTDEITGLVFSPDGKTLASWGVSGTIKLWRTQ